MTEFGIKSKIKSFKGLKKLPVFIPVTGQIVLQMHSILLGGIVAAVVIMIIEFYLKRLNSKDDLRRSRLLRTNEESKVKRVGNALLFKFHRNSI